MPVPQIEWHSSNEELRIAPERGRLMVSSLTGTEDKSRQPSIDVQRSFAIKDGVTYKIATSRNAYVDSRKNLTPWTVGWIYLISDQNGESRRGRWSSGEWQLHLEYTDSGLRGPIDAKFRLWTFWYNPLIRVISGLSDAEQSVAACRDGFFEGRHWASVT